MSKRTRFGRCSNCQDRPVATARCGSVYLCIPCAQRYIDNRRNDDGGMTANRKTRRGPPYSPPSTKVEKMENESDSIQLDIHTTGKSEISEIKSVSI